MLIKVVWQWFTLSNLEFKVFRTYCWRASFSRLISHWRVNIVDRTNWRCCDTTLVSFLILFTVEAGLVKIVILLFDIADCFVKLTWFSTTLDLHIFNSHWSWCDRRMLSSLSWTVLRHDKHGLVCLSLLVLIDKRWLELLAHNLFHWGCHGVDCSIEKTRFFLLLLFWKCIHCW